VEYESNSSQHASILQEVDAVTATGNHNAAASSSGHAQGTNGGTVNSYHY
jgi:hypothetical protein